MVRMLVGNDGIRGVDIQTRQGTVSLNADKGGAVEVSDSRTINQLKAEGFTVASSASGFSTRGYPCGGCRFVSVFKIYDCPKCGTHNNYKEVEAENGDSDKSDN